MRQLQYNYGDQECAGQSNVPVLDFNKLFEEVTDETKKQHYQREAISFFRNK